MNSQKQHQRILFGLRALTGLGLLIAFVTIGLIDWTLTRVRHERALATAEQDQLKRASTELRQRAADSRGEIQNVLDEAAPLTEPQAIPNLIRFIETQHDSQGQVRPAFGRFTEFTTQLGGISQRARDWRAGYDLIWQDVSRQETPGKVRALITQLRGAVEILEGRRRLDDAIRHRRWRNAGGGDAQRLAQEILTEQGREQSQGVNDFKNDLAECARLVELLAGEEQFDNLADLKDNKLKPVLDHLSQTIAAFGTLDPATIEQLKTAIVGAGPEAGGLFALRRNLVRLRREREKLKLDVAALFQNIETANVAFAQSANARTEELTQQMESSLATGRQRMLIFGIGSSVIFLGLARLISGGIRSQVQALDGARAEAEAGRESTQKLVLEQQAAAVELAKVHRQLLDTSRQAGMAEVATSVLHNVGNVLNSVNVSATVVSDTVRKSERASLAKVVALLNQHEGDLAEFLSRDAKGKQIVGFLDTLAKHLSAEQEKALDELKVLQKNIEHIKEVVAMQQSYAKVSGVTEKLKVVDLLEDTLRMNGESLAKHDVEVVREFADVPDVTVDKHKLLQILVNLIRNAKHSCDEAKPAQKRLTLRVANGDGRVKISVTDNGLGIPPENLTRIFNHGFTTKKEGHGFGLHSGALAAREMGGALVVHSEGAGLGATFTVELPLQPNN